MLVSNKNKRRLSARITTLILTLLLCLMQAVPVLAFNIPTPTASFYVNDTADLLSAESEDYIIAANEDLNAKTGAQVVVVTISDLDDASIEEYATELFRSYGIGNAEKNNGVLVLLSLEDRECRIEVGYGLEGAINDAKAGRIMDTYMIPYFRDNKWDEGMINGFDAVLDVIAEEYDIVIEHNEAIVPSGTEAEDDDSMSDRLMWECIIAAAIALVVGLAFGRIFELQATVPTIIFLIIDLVALCFIFTLGYALLTFLFSLVTCGIGWAITSPDLPGSSDGSYHSSSYSSGSRSSYGSGSSHNSGGGGRSGGGGASRKF